MQNHFQVTNSLAELFGDTPVAMAPEYWHSVAGEIAALGGSISSTEIQDRRRSVEPLMIDLESGMPKQISAQLNHHNTTPKSSVAHLKLSGVMISNDFLWIKGINHLAAELMAADANPNVAGILLEVDSGGGSVVAGQMLLSTMQGLTTPVVVLAHYMASAAVMATLPANSIVASSPGTQVGSIGALWNFSRSAINHQNSNYKTLYAKRSTNKNKILRAILNGDFSFAQSTLDKTADLFVAAVKKHRRVSSDALTGEMYFAQEALMKGLVDRIGTFRDALQILARAIEKGESTKKSLASTSSPLTMTSIEAIIANSLKGAILSTAPPQATREAYAKSMSLLKTRFDQIRGRLSNLETHSEKYQPGIETLQPKEQIDRYLASGALSNLIDDVKSCLQSLPETVKSELANEVQNLAIKELPMIEQRLSRLEEQPAESETAGEAEANNNNHQPSYLNSPMNREAAKLLRTK